MLNKFFIENKFKSKLKIIGEFGHVFGVLGKLSLSDEVHLEFLDSRCGRY
jgi:hypothetical protein